jgi:hypothetical protein
MTGAISVLLKGSRTHGGHIAGQDAYHHRRLRLRSRFGCVHTASVGYWLHGSRVVVGSHGLQLLTTSDETKFLAELGIIFSFSCSWWGLNSLFPQ